MGCLLVSGTLLYGQVLLPHQSDVPRQLSLNGKWAFKYLPTLATGADSLFYTPDFEVSNWATIQTPGTWEMQGFATPRYGRDQEAGTGLYRTRFQVPAQWKNNPVYLAFDGVQYGYNVWVNGHFAGSFASSFNRHVFNVSEWAIPGQFNTLAVQVTTRPKGWEFDTNDDWSLSGIIRNVTLFSLPPVHVQDLVIQTTVEPGKAQLHLRAVVEKNAATWPAGRHMKGELIAPDGKTVTSFRLQQAAADTATMAFTGIVPVNRPELWNAENPKLYTVRCYLEGDSRLQQVTEKTGIRQVSWNKGVLKLNGTPIKLRGATHHDLSPINGRSITEAEMRKDLLLMQQANINFIRTSHYPPDERLLALCDSMGFYVMDEVPFGYGDEHLKDSTYLPLLLQRAQATINRDKNHACVIAWSVGNENPVTALGVATGKYVKQLDSTRPYCFPQTPSEFEKMYKTSTELPDLLSPHYPLVPQLAAYATQFDRPMIVTEYAHALGLDFDRAEALYEIMYAHPKLAGGAVWEFFDQGILRKAPQPVVPGEPTFYAWASKDSLYDTGGNQGTDGIVYANRVPQVDYWQIRKVYTPVKALDDTLHYKPGQQQWQIKINNRHDFTNLRNISCRWELFADTTLIQSGNPVLACAPHDTALLTIQAHLPATPTAQYYYLRVSFRNKKQYRFYEKTYVIQQTAARPLLQALVKPGTVPALQHNTLTTGNYTFTANPANGNISLTNANGNTLISGGPVARAGRKTTMTEEATATNRRSKNMYTLWRSHLLQQTSCNVTTFNNRELSMQYSFQPDSPAQRAFNGAVAFRFNDSGFIQVNYHFTPSGTGALTDAGLSLLLPDSLTEFRWIGKGPYEAYPGKNRLSEFGMYHLNSKDLYYAGNRQQTDCAVFTDKKGNGFALLATAADIAVERSATGIVVSHNAIVSGRFNKYNWPDALHTFENTKEISGSFILIPLTATWPATLQKLLGSPGKTAAPFQPFYYSYDQ